MGSKVQCYDFHKRTSRTSNIVDQKSKYRSHRESVILVKIEYPSYERLNDLVKKGFPQLTKNKTKQNTTGYG